MKIPKEIKLVNQYDNLSCVLACMSMVTGKKIETVKSVIEKINIKAPLTNMQLLRTLSYFRVLALPVNTSDESLYRGSLYIITVPSLNCERGNHAIVADARGDELLIYDPQDGVEGKKFYDESNLKNWSSPIKIIDISKEG